MHIAKYIFVFYSMLSLTGCSNNQVREMICLSDLPPVIIPTEQDYVVEVKNWLAIGAFEFNSLFSDPVTSFSRSDLKQYNVKEGTINEAAIEKLQRKGVDVFLINGVSPQVKLFSYITERKEKKSNFYLVSRIVSDKPQEAILILDGSNSYAVWVNGEKQLNVTGKYNTNKISDRFVNVSLKAGENILFVKINRGTNNISWDLICAIASTKESERIFRASYASDFVINPIINNSLEVYSGPYLNGEVEVLDNNDQVIASGSFEKQNTNDKPFVLSGFDQLEEGFYKTTLTVGDSRLEEIIYKGDYNKFVEKAKGSIEAINDNSPYAQDLKVAMQKVNYANDKPGDPNSIHETRYINKNKVFWGYSLYRMFAKNALTQLMTYNVGGNKGVFVFHNSRKTQQKLPLIIIVPFASEKNSIIEDWYTSNLDQIETDNRLADQYGFAVAWIYADGKNYSADKTEKEIEAVINRLKSECDIDEENVFIMGDCEGGRRALVQVARTSNRYAACGLMFPLTLSGGADGTPINLIQQMDNTPMIIKHGTNDNKSPIENSRKFYAEAQKHNIPIEYIETDGSHVYLERDYRKFIFDFFNRIATKQE